MRERRARHAKVSGPRRFSRFSAAAAPTPSLLASPAADLASQTRSPSPLPPPTRVLAAQTRLMQGSERAAEPFGVLDDRDRGEQMRQVIQVALRAASATTE